MFGLRMVHDHIPQMIYQTERSVYDYCVTTVIIIIAMWSDPSLQLDLNYLELLPSLDESSACEYPIEGKQLLKLMNAAVASYNIPAIIGATALLFLKNDLPAQRKEFSVVHLGNLDRIFYLVSEASLNSKLQNHLLRLVQMAARRWFCDAPKEELLKIQLHLKAELNLFEKVMQLVKEANEQKKELTIKMLKMFVPLLSHEKATIAEYNEKFKDHGLYIFKNKKELYLLNVIYEIEFLLFEQIHKQTQLYNPSNLIEYVKMKLLGVTVCRRPSVNIESTAFLLRKLFIVKSKHRIPQDIYHQFLLQTEEHIDKIFSRINLQLRTGHYSFHMKNNHFFDYLEAIFDPAVQNQYRLIREWKESLSKAIVEALPNEPREAKAEDLQEAVFLLQLRNWQDFLWNSQDVNEFPFITSKIVSRLIRNPLLKSHGVEISTSIVSLIEKGEGLALFGNANIIERSIIFYYIHYYEYFSFFSNQDSANISVRVTSLQRFKLAINHQELLELLQFYLLEMQLGNYYKVTNQCNFENENLVHRLIYEAFIDILNSILLDCLTNYKSIETTKDLKRIKATAKYLILLIQAICPEYPVPLICKGCKQTGQYLLCAECEYICLGVKLCSGRNPMNLSRDRYFYQQMLGRLQQKCKEAYYRLSVEMQVSSNDWLYMLSYLLQTLLPL